MFWNVWKADKEILEKFENLDDVRFVEFKCAVEGNPVVFVQFEVKMIEVWNALIHTIDHFLLKMKKGRLVERDPYMTSESRGCVVTHWTEMKLQFVRLREDSVDENWLFGSS
jgi:hypothetical protein